MPQRRSSAQAVFEHHERRLAAGETSRRFYVREEHLQILRRFMIANGLPNQHSAMQALLEQFRREHNIGDTARPRPRNGNLNTREST